MTKTATLADAPNNSALAQVGEIKMWPVATPPTGYLVCDGAPVSRTTYAALFALVGTAFGAGDGSTTFNLPNYTNRMAIGAGGLYSAAATGGSKDAIVVDHGHPFSATTGNQSQDHTHTFSGSTNTAGAHTHGPSTGGSFIITGAGATVGFDGGNNYFPTTSTTSTISAGSHSHTVSGTNGFNDVNHTHDVSGTTDSTGSSGNDANLPPYLAIFFIIKV